MKTISIETEIPADHELKITVPADMPSGPAQVIVIAGTGTGKTRLLSDLRRSKFFGLWKDRKDITDSQEYARKLREEAWRRQP